MKFLIASDIHGSAYYCEKLVKAYRDSGADRLLLLGDILYHGPRNDLPEDYSPKRTAELLNGIAKDIICVRGNCEAQVDSLMLDFPVLNESAYVFDEGKTLFLVHGHDESLLKSIPDGAVVLSGHTHIPADLQKGSVRYINPGSVSIPKQGSAHSYVIYDGGEFEFKEL